MKVPTRQASADSDRREEPAPIPDLDPLDDAEEQDFPCAFCGVKTHEFSCQYCVDVYYCCEDHARRHW